MNECKSLIDNFFKKFNLLSVLGPTASGKTAFAANLAYLLNGEIVSADSRQVYRDMNLGTGKDYGDYVVSGIGIPYHLIDIVDAGHKYNLFEYVQDFYKVFEEITQRSKLPILCGGTGLYAEAIIRNFDIRQVPPNEELRKQLETKSLDELAEILAGLKKLHNKTDIDTKKRAIRAIEIEMFYRNQNIEKPKYPLIKSLNIGLKYDRQLQKERITSRLKQRLEQGMIDEVKQLLYKGVAPETLIYYGLEYKFVTLFVLGKLSFDDMFEQLNIAIHQFAKRQMTFFRHMEKNGVEINWIDAQLKMEDKINQALKIISHRVLK